MASTKVEKHAGVIRQPNDLVIIMELVTKKIFLAKRTDIKVTEDPEEYLLGRAPNFDDHYELYEPEYNLMICSLSLFRLGWHASWERLHGRCNNVYAMDALTEEALMKDPLMEDPVLILDRSTGEITIVKRSYLKSGHKHFLGRVPSEGGTRVYDADYRLIAHPNYSKLDKRARRLRGLGKCNDLYASEALIGDEEKKKVKAPETRGSQDLRVSQIPRSSHVSPKKSDGDSLRRMAVAASVAGAF